MRNSAALMNVAISCKQGKTGHESSLGLAATRSRNWREYRLLTPSLTHRGETSTLQPARHCMPFDCFDEDVREGHEH